jgi:catechol 2,3-dioxygenase-like lactoylglutathione lyase family enzyme
MPAVKLSHYSVRTSDLEASRRFYTKVLGFREGYRPAFKFPGAWLYLGNDESDYGIVHLIGADTADAEASAYLGARDAASLHGTGAVDHLAFHAIDLADMRRRLDRAQLCFRERTVPDLGLHQVFFEDPSGLTIEMNFAAHEATGNA